MDLENLVIQVSVATAAAEQGVNRLRSILADLQSTTRTTGQINTIVTPQAEQGVQRTRSALNDLTSAAGAVRPVADLVQENEAERVQQISESLGELSQAVGEMQALPPVAEELDEGLPNALAQISVLDRELSAVEASIRAARAAGSPISDNLASQLSTARAEIERLRAEINNLRSNPVPPPPANVASGYQQLGIAATAALAGIVLGLRQCMQEYKNFQSATMGLTSVVSSVGEDMNQVNGAMKELTASGLLTQQDAAAGIKNLLALGQSLNEARDMMKRLTDSAAFNRQAHYSLSEAVRVTTEGLRMENSMLSDAAGMQKNIAKIHEEYAKSIGKTAQELTQAEKAQANYVGVMKETEFAAGDAQKVSESYMGTQEQLNSILKEGMASFGESFAPILSQTNTVLAAVLKFLGELATTFPAATAGAVVFVTALLGLVAAGTALNQLRTTLIPMIQSFWSASISVAGLTATMGPLVLGLSAAVAGLAMVAAENVRMKEAMKQAEDQVKQLIEAEKLLAEVQKYGASEDNVIKLKNYEMATDDLITKYDELTQKIKEAAETTNLFEGLGNMLNDILGDGPTKAVQELNMLKEALQAAGISIDDVREKQKALNDVVAEGAGVTREELLSQLESVAAKKNQLAEDQKYLEQLKKSKQGTQEYAQAYDNLIKRYPELVMGTKAAIDATERQIAVEDLANRETYARLQMLSMVVPQELRDAEAKALSAVASANLRIAEALLAGDLYGLATAAAEAAKQLNILKQVQEAISGVKNPLEGGDYDKDIPIYKPISGGGSKKTGSKSAQAYKNEALEEELKLLNHKRAMEAITAQEELDWLERIRATLVKTADERMSLDEKIHEVKKRMFDDDIAWIDHQRSMGRISKLEEMQLLEKLTQEYVLSYSQRITMEERLYEIKKQNLEKELELYDLAVTWQRRLNDFEKTLLGDDYDPRKELDLINHEISLREKAIEKINSMTWLGAEERIEMVAEEMSRIEELHQEYFVKEVELLNKAHQKKLEELKKQGETEAKLRKEDYDAELKELNDWKKKQTEIINSTYENKIKMAEQASDAVIEGLEAELAALETYEKALTRQEQDEADATRLGRLNDDLTYERDEFNQFSLKKEIQRAEAEYAKRKQKEELEDRKAAIKERIALAKEAARVEKEQFKEVKENELRVLNETFDKRKEALDTALNDDLEAIRLHYEDLQIEADKNALRELELLKTTLANKVQQLKDFAKDSGDWGSAAGQNFASAFNAHLNKVQQRIDDLKSELASLGGSVSSTAAAATSNVVNSNNRTATLNTTFIQSEALSPSEIARQQRLLAESLLA